MTARGTPLTGLARAPHITPPRWIARRRTLRPRRDGVTAPAGRGPMTTRTSTRDSDRPRRGSSSRAGPCWLSCRVEADPIHLPLPFAVIARRPRRTARARPPRAAATATAGTLTRPRVGRLRPVGPSGVTRPCATTTGRRAAARARSSTPRLRRPMRAPLPSAGRGRNPRLRLSCAPNGSEHLNCPNPHARALADQSRPSITHLESPPFCPGAAPVLFSLCCVR